MMSYLARQGKARQGGRIVMICERMATGKIPLPAKKAGWKIFWGIEEAPPPYINHGVVVLLR